MASSYVGRSYEHLTRPYCQEGIADQQQRTQYHSTLSKRERERTNSQGPSNSTLNSFYDQCIHWTRLLYLWEAVGDCEDGDPHNAIAKVDHRLKARLAAHTSLQWRCLPSSVLIGKVYSWSLNKLYLPLLMMYMYWHIKVMYTLVLKLVHVRTLIN